MWYTVSNGGIPPLIFLISYHYPDAGRRSKGGVLYMSLQFHTAKFIVTGTIFRLFLGISLVLAVALFLSVFIPWLRDFRHEMRYINMEIQRNEGRERERWVRRKKRLWLSILPFFRYH